MDLEYSILKIRNLKILTDATNLPRFQLWIYSESILITAFGSMTTIFGSSGSSPPLRFEWDAAYFNFMGAGVMKLKRITFFVGPGASTLALSS